MSNQTEDREHKTPPEAALSHLYKALEEMQPNFPGHPTQVAKRYEYAEWEIRKVIAVFEYLAKLL